jgi:hypothetical protein
LKERNEELESKGSTIQVKLEQKEEALEKIAKENESLEALKEENKALKQDKEVMHLKVSEILTHLEEIEA